MTVELCGYEFRIMLLVVRNIGFLRMKWVCLVNIHRPFYLSDLPGMGRMLVVGWIPTWAVSRGLQRQAGVYKEAKGMRLRGANVWCFLENLL